jgi:HAD superfamily hydrolase (TIGR01459 family)
MTMFAPQIARLGEISDCYDAILCDIWGVLHNGVASFVEASKSLASFRRRGGAVILITNAPRPSAVIRCQLLKLGVFPEAFDAVVTSGDVTIHLIAERIDDPPFHLGPARDLSLFEAAEAVTGRRPALVPLAEAGYCVCTGLRDDRTETPDDYEDELRAVRERSLPMVCANPDIVIHRGDTPVYCAGALARRYEDIGGEVVYAGKPYLPIYERSIAEAQRARGVRIDRCHILAVGDGMKTDIAGAAAAGIDALFITGGIHRSTLHGQALDASADPNELRRLFAEYSLWPTAAMSALRP